MTRKVWGPILIAAAITVWGCSSKEHQMGDAEPPLLDSKPVASAAPVENAPAPQPEPARSITVASAESANLGAASSGNSR